MARSFDVEDLVALGRVGASALSPDGTWVASAVSALSDDGTKYVSSVWRVPTDGGEATLLLQGAFADASPAFDRGGRLHFLSNRTDEKCGPDDEPDDDAKTQLWRLDAEGSLTRVSDEPLGVRAYRIARRADVIVLDVPVLPGVDHDRQADVADDLKKGPSILRYAKMPVRFWDHWLPEQTHHLVALSDGERRVLTPDRTERLPEWSWDLSDDGLTVVFERRIDGVHRLWASELVAVHVPTAEQRVLVGDANHSIGGICLSPDGSTVAGIRNAWVEGEAWDADLILVAVADGSLRVLAADWDVHPNPHDWTRDGASLLVSADVRASVPLFAVDAGTGARTVLVMDGSVASVSIGEEALVVVRSTLMRPPHLLHVDLVTGARAELAPLDDLGLDLAALLQVEEVFVPADDGAPVQVRIVSARDRHGPSPALLWIHGGPIGAWGDGWHWRWCPAVAALAGFVVVLPNPRGSTGFGQDFVRGIWGNTWGGACYTDLMRVTDALEARDDVDNEAIVAMGGSFGGYMTNWIGTQTDRFAGCITHAGLWDFAGFYGVTDWPAYWSFMFGVNPWTEADALHRYSPAAHVAGWRSPSLILHGEKDFRVPISEALSQFEALHAHGVDAELAVFPDENHWILKPRNIIAWYETWLEFAGRCVGRGEDIG